jgi:hypothetical protein
VAVVDDWAWSVFVGPRVVDDLLEEAFAERFEKEKLSYL